MAALKKNSFEFIASSVGSNPNKKLVNPSKIYFHFPWLLLFTLLISNSLFAQISFDVKTTMEEKQQLHIIKLAVINALKQSNWARVTEYGEDYSLWLTNLKRTNDYESFKTEIDLDLRTPAMISRGKHITSLHITVNLDTTGISNVHAASDTLMNTLLVQGLQSSGLINEFTELFSSAIPFGSYFISSFVANVLTELKRQPTPMESYEANLLAAKAIVDLKKLFDNK